MTLATPEIFRVRLRFFKVALVASSTLAIIPVSIAQPTDRFDAWWARLSAKGAEGPNVDSLRLHYTIAETTPLPNQAELNALRERIKAHPAHPDGERLATMEWRLKHSEPYITDEIMWRLNGRWRWSVTHPDGHFDDAAFDTSHAWQLGQKYVRVLDPRRLDGSPYNVRMFENNLMTNAAMMVNGDIGSFAEMLGAKLNAALDSGKKRWKASGAK